MLLANIKAKLSNCNENQLHVINNYIDNILSNDIESKYNTIVDPFDKIRYVLILSSKSTATYLE